MASCLSLLGKYLIKFFLFEVISNCVQENYIMSSIKKNSKVCHQLMLTDGQKRSIELQFVLKSVMPIVSLEFYGSRIYGAASENSDVNVSIATGKHIWWMLNSSLNMKKYRFTGFAFHSFF